MDTDLKLTYIFYEAVTFKNIFPETNYFLSIIDFSEQGGGKIHQKLRCRLHLYLEVEDLGTMGRYQVDGSRRMETPGRGSPILRQLFFF